MRLLAALMLGLGIGPMVDEPTDTSSLIAWPAGPLEVRVAIPEPISEAEAGAIAGNLIPFVRAKSADNGIEPEPLGTLRIAGVRREHEGRTLVLLTDPHPAEAVYEPDLPEAIGALRYDLSGVEAEWSIEEGEGPEWSGWLPELDLRESRDRLAASVEHQEAFDLMTREGVLTLRTLLALPDEEVTVAIEADRPIEAELMFLPLEFDPDHRAEEVVEPFGEPVELFLIVPTGPEWDGALPELRLTVWGSGEGPDQARSIARSAQVLPWAPAPIEDEAELPPLPDELAGGDPVRGEDVFFSEASQCSNCHQIGGRGGLVGPDLSGIGAGHSLAEIYREIEAPSAEIDPDYLPYTVAMLDGRVFVGVVRAEGTDQIRLVGSDAQEILLERSGIEEIRPGTTSIMPVGLVGALGQRDLRDLLAFLAECRDDE